MTERTVAPVQFGARIDDRPDRTHVGVPDCAVNSDVALDCAANFAVAPDCAVNFDGVPDCAGNVGVVPDFFWNSIFPGARSACPPFCDLAQVASSPPGDRRIWPRRHAGKRSACPLAASQRLLRRPLETRGSPGIVIFILANRPPWRIVIFFLGNRDFAQ